MSNLDQFTELNEKVEALKSKIAEAKGAYEQVMKRIASEVGAKTLAAANKKLKKLTEEEAKVSQEYDEAFENFVQEWGEVLENVDTD